jgi:hypothetical protein
MNTSAEARIIASFTFIVALLFGAWGALDHLLVGPDTFLLTAREPGRLFIALLPVAATVVAFRATNAAEVAWARSLGGATVMLGVLSSLGGVLYFLSTW